MESRMRKVDKSTRGRRGKNRMKKIEEKNNPETARDRPEKAEKQYRKKLEMRCEGRRGTENTNTLDIKLFMRGSRKFSQWGPDYYFFSRGGGGGLLLFDIQTQSVFYKSDCKLFVLRK